MKQSSARISAVAVWVAIAGLPTHGTARAGEHPWRPVTEAGATYQPAESPLDPFGRPTHWRWTGVFGAVRDVGSWDAIGPVLLGSYSENDYTAGVGLLWDHAIDDNWSLLTTPGFALQDFVDRKADPFPGYFAEMGLSYRHSVTIAARLEAVRYKPESYLTGAAWDVEPAELTGHVWRIDARVGRAPGAMALGVAALFAVAVGVSQATDAR